ncbi:MAG: hypothetical protein N838_10465 [Thiohalocapsa sp. PB-PSB1]|jgi:hypothetical protein|nr:MAG: hypothetical protein N838_10465 [Thiohalocapsa sp. PB-PSB1]
MIDFARNARHWIETANWWIRHINLIKTDK